MVRGLLCCGLLAFLGLAGLASAQLPFRLNVEITRPPFADLQETVELNCRSYQPMIASDNICLFIMPDDTVLKVNFETGDVTDEDNNAVSDYTGRVSLTGRNCGLTITSMKNKDFGQWSCKMNDNNENNQFRMGTFQLFREEEAYSKDIRLPRHLEPYVHTFDLVPQLSGDYTIDGHAGLIMKNLRKFSNQQQYFQKVYVHIKDIVIDEAATAVRGIRLLNTVAGHEYDLEREFYIIHLGEELHLEDWDTYHLVEIDFTSYLNDDLRGFYRSTYDDAQGNPVTLASTQFQYIDARRAFPCMDEPDMKGRFQVSLGHEQSLTAISNMPVLTTDEDMPEAGWNIDTFRMSETMSPYLIAFLISDFETTPAPNAEDFNIVHVPGKASQATLAADAGPSILSYFEEYFGIPYVLPKVDMAAIPDFKYGAMENWGLITYRESTLLFEDGVSTQTDRDLVIEVIAHELAHMWFGNLVTMEWWEDLWLNEGFATYVENIGKDEYWPESQSKDRVVLVDLHDVFALDALESTLPISTQVDNPAYDMTFSRLSYGKGNVLLRMIENFVSLETFNTGIQSYLNNLMFLNADRYDLWTYLDAAAHVDGTLNPSLNLGNIMEGYTAREGYPVVTVTAVQGHEISLSQKRFFLSPDAAPSDYLWYIPINSEHPGGAFDDTMPSAWMMDNNEDATITVEKKPYILNVKQTGYYRVNYDMTNWLGLANSLAEDNTKIDRLNRAQMLDDSFNLARAGQLDYIVPLPLATYLVDEADYIPMKAALNNFAYLDLMFRTEGDEDYSHLKYYVTSLFGSKFDDYGFNAGNNEVFFDALIRDELITWMCLYEYGTCTADAATQFANWMDNNNPDNNNPIDVDIKSPVYESAIRTGGSSEWNFLFDRFLACDVDGERRRMIYGLGSTVDQDTINNFLDMTIDDTSGVRKQDTDYVYRALGRSDVGRQAQFDWLNSNYDAVKAYFDFDFSATVNEIVESFATGSKTQEDIDALQAFWDANKADLAGSESTIVKAQDDIAVNMAWNDANYATVANWLVDYNPANTLPPNPTTLGRGDETCIPDKSGYGFLGRNWLVQLS